MEDKSLICEEMSFESESELGNKNPQVLKIEKISLWSNGRKYFDPIIRTDSSPVIFMTFYQEDLRVSFKDVWADLEKKFPGETLLIADIGCYKGGAIREAINYFISLNQEQYAFFGIDSRNICSHSEEVITKPPLFIVLKEPPVEAPGKSLVLSLSLSSTKL